MPEKNSGHSRSAGASRDFRKRAEALLAQSGSEIAAIPGEDIKALVHELQIHQLELEIQNENLREARLELSESCDLYNDLYEFAPVGYLTLDSEGAIPEANLTAATMLGVDRATLIGARISDFATPDTQDALYLFQRRVFSTEGIRSCDLVMHRPDATLLDVRLVSIAFQDKATGESSCRTALIDITGEKDAEAALRKNEEQLRAILDAAADAIITINQQDIIVGANPATERIFGYAINEVLGQNVSILIPSPFREEHDGYLTRYQQTGEAHIIGIGREVVGRRKDGSTFPADLAVNEVDHLGFYTGIVRDISQRKRAEEAFRLEHEFNENLIETTQSIILVLDPDGRIIRFNSILERLSGWSLEEVEGLDSVDLFVPERDRKRVRESFQQTVHGEASRGNVNPILTKAGEEREIEWYHAPLLEADGTLVGLICSGIDVTERRNLEQEVYKASEEEKSRIARDLHDTLGSALTGIGYLVAALSRKLQSGKTVEPAEADSIQEQVRKAIAQTRALSRGLQPVSDDPMALAVALRKHAEWIRRTTELSCRFIAPDPKVTVGDPIAANHLFRIAQEAANNAIRHSGATHLTIRLQKKADRHLILSITDNGKGFDTADTRGNGLGLHTMEYRAKAIDAELTIRPRKRSTGSAVVCVW